MERSSGRRNQELHVLFVSNLFCTIRLLCSIQERAKVLLKEKSSAHLQSFAFLQHMHECYQGEKIHPTCSLTHKRSPPPQKIRYRPQSKQDTRDLWKRSEGKVPAGNMALGCAWLVRGPREGCPAGPQAQSPFSCHNRLRHSLLGLSRLRCPKFPASRLGLALRFCACLWNPTYSCCHLRGCT